MADLTNPDIVVGYPADSAWDRASGIGHSGAWGAAGPSGENVGDVNGQKAKVKKHFFSDPTCACAGTGPNGEPLGDGKPGASAPAPGGTGGAGHWGATPFTFTLSVGTVQVVPDNGTNVIISAVGGTGGIGGTGGSGGVGAPGGDAGAIPAACLPGGDGSPTCPLNVGGTGGAGGAGGTGGNGGTGGTGGVITIVYETAIKPRISTTVSKGSGGGAGSGGSSGVGGLGGMNTQQSGEPPTYAATGPTGGPSCTGKPGGAGADGKVFYKRAKAVADADGGASGPQG